MVLLDETALIDRYSALQRAKSYAEVTRRVCGDRGDPAAPLGAVLTTMDDFEAQLYLDLLGSLRLWHRESRGRAIK